MTPHRPLRPAGPRSIGGRHLAAALLSLALSSCGEPDPPPDPSGGDGATVPVADGTDPVAVDATSGHDGDASPEETTAIAEATPPTTVTGVPDDPSPPVTPDPPADSPVATVADCAGTLPCRLETADEGLAATLTSADGEALDGSGPLRVDLVLEARSRDATVGIEPTSSVVSGGQVLAVDASRLGLSGAPGARDEASFPLVAGVPINGHVTFGGTLLGNPARLDRVTLHLSEAGTTFAATFIGVPLGPEPGAPVDCAGTLPCRWTSAAGDVTLALVDAAPGRWNHATRLIVTWSLSATRPLEIAVIGTGRVVNAADETLEPYGIELGGVESRDGTVLARALAAGESIVGRTVPRRVPETGGTLNRVEIAVVERRSPRAPRWRPVFLDVPLGAAEPDG